MIALLVESAFPIERLIDALVYEGVAFVICKWKDSLNDLTIPDELEAAVLISSTFSIVDIGEQTKKARERIGEKSCFIVCTPMLTEKENLTLQKCGANRVVTPRSSSPEHIAERIIAELILLEVGYSSSSLGPIKGSSKPMRNLFSSITTLATLYEPILLLGGTGTGKSMIANEIHSLSKRSGEYVELNCGEYTHELVRSELFGHVKGAFSGADRDKTGLMVKANGGTLFFDEIAELDSRIQASLLKVLEDYKFRPVGSDRIISLNTRLIFATNKDLEQLVKEKRFRQDLLARIRRFQIIVPPLRDHRVDILLLAHHFIEVFNNKYPDRQVKIPPGAFDCLLHCEWPENIRQLVDVLWQAAAYRDADGNISTLHLKKEASKQTHRLPSPLDTPVYFDPTIDTYHDALTRMQKTYLETLISQTNGDSKEMINKSGLRKSQVYSLLKKLREGRIFNKRNRENV